MSRRDLIAGMADAAAGSTLLPAVLHASAPSDSEVPALKSTDDFNVLFIRHAESVVNVAPEPGVPDDGVTYPLRARRLTAVDAGPRVGQRRRIGDLFQHQVAVSSDR